MGKQLEWRSTIPVVQPWNAVGDALEGWLISKLSTPGPGDQLRGEYILDTADGVRLVFGTAKIDQGLDRVDEGRYIRITYLGEEETRRGYKVKLFNVEVASGDAVNTETGELIGY
ncbi:hypothetical protein CMI37_29505 [Candidatus Pacearchaeota archaeon]|nr:hypothetical protein [Candidatus Pacearchaeota archaeon]|tara:strand:+ start:172 stop:516 length:345 start_codon:yes stop_codon:yes gene_type:complete